MTKTDDNGLMALWLDGCSEHNAINQTIQP